LSYDQANIFEYQYQDGAGLGLKGPSGDNYLYTHLQVDAQGSYQLPKGFKLVVYGLTKLVKNWLNTSATAPRKDESAACSDGKMPTPAR